MDDVPLLVGEHLTIRPLVALPGLRGAGRGHGGGALLLVGDDWAEDHHDVEIQDETGRRLGKARLPEGSLGSPSCTG